MPYDKNRDHYDVLAAYAKKEHDEDQRPAIKNAIDLSDYDTVFIGYPMWWPNRLSSMSRTPARVRAGKLRTRRPWHDSQGMPFM